MNHDDATERLRNTLIASCKPDEKSGCWIWNRQISNSGYGRVMLRHADGTEMASAHRASYRAFIAPLQDDIQIEQTCGERLCINPAHLRRKEH